MSEHVNRPQKPNHAQDKAQQEKRDGYGNKKVEGPNRPST